MVPTNWSLWIHIKQAKSDKLIGESTQNQNE